MMHDQAHNNNSGDQTAPVSRPLSFLAVAPSSSRPITACIESCPHGHRPTSWRARPLTCLLGTDESSRNPSTNAVPEPHTHDEHSGASPTSGSRRGAEWRPTNPETRPRYTAFSQCETRRLGPGRSQPTAKAFRSASAAYFETRHAAGHHQAAARTNSWAIRHTANPERQQRQRCERCTQQDRQLWGPRQQSHLIHLAVLEPVVCLAIWTGWETSWDARPAECGRLVHVQR